MRSLADDLMLVLLSPETARPVVDAQRLPPALAGAVLLDLALADRLDVTPGARRSQDKLSVRPGPPVGDALHDDALDRLGSGERRGRAAVQKIARWRLPREVQARLAEQGLVEHTPGGFLKLTRNVPDGSARDVLVGEVVAALTGSQPPTQRQAALVSLLHAVGAVAKVAPGTGLTRREVARRAKEVSEGEWAGAAVLAAVRAAQAGTSAAVTAALAAGAAG